ncbi:hypothetical protein [Desulfatitalea alkaliphila]|uniref:Uncharacterized protein n=1 Tax=Desulfatitalea alkaliphila TaxID=2929485 RepID=A0AA41UJV3_9BACT|nr:hypothetical protein [Desulfatitalea alkaliphila]MCJ8502365.1 hypothetical protein [Desulfatitalea alkaliphila]
MITTTMPIQPAPLFCRRLGKDSAAELSRPIFPLFLFPPAKPGGIRRNWRNWISEVQGAALHRRLAATLNRGVGPISGWRPTVIRSATGASSENREKSRTKDRSRTFKKQEQSKMSNEFKSISAVAKYLKNRGFCLPGSKTPIARSKVFSDVKRGLFVFSDPSAITQAEVDAYCVAAGLIQMDRDRKAPGADPKVFTDKAAAQARLMAAKASKAEHELEALRGRYLLKDDVRLEQALKIAIFESGFKTLVRTRVEDMIRMVGGDPAKSRMLCDWFFSEIDSLLAAMGDMPELDIRLTKRGDRPAWSLDGLPDQQDATATESPQREDG